MALPFAPGDDLIFQLESGFGLLRILAVEERDGQTVWHLLAYEDFFPDVETAEIALLDASHLGIRAAHLPLTDYAFGKTPAARLGNRPVTEEELIACRAWSSSGDAEPFDRSALLLLGLR
jgi:hypothetical protein